MLIVIIALMKENTMNMTEGSPTKLILLFSIPMLIGNIFQQLYSFADSMIVGRLLGPDALASIGSTGAVSFFFFALSLGIGTGGGIITSQFFGRGDTAKVKNCIMNNAYIMIVMPIFVGGIAFFLAEPVLYLLRTPAEIKANALLYLRINCVGMLFVSFYNYISSMLRSLGDSKTPLYFLIFSCLLNVGLDFLFIKAFNLGVFGAGVATVISQFLSGILCLIFAVKTNSYFKFSKNDYIVNFPVIRDTIKLGMPVSLQFAMIAISCMELQSVVNSFGPVAVAAFTATEKIEEFVHLPYQTLSAALSTFVGQNYGAKKIDRVFKGYYKGLLIMAIFTTVIIPVIQFTGKAITSLFVESDVVTQMGGRALQITSIFYYFLGIIYMVRGILYGVGDSLFSFINGIVEVIGRVVFPLVLMRCFNLQSPWVIWWSVGLVWSIAGITAWWRYAVIRKRLLLH